MPQYNKDMFMRCSQSQCNKKNQCYRYWLGQEFKNTDQYASFYAPDKPVTDGCTFYVDKKYFE